MKHKKQENTQVRSVFADIKALAERMFGREFTARGENEFSLVFEGLPVTFAAVPGDDGMVMLRSRVVDTGGVARKGSLAVAALEGNFFWLGTKGATLSLGRDGWLWLTDRRPVEALDDADNLAACISDLLSTTVLWQERSVLHG